MSQRRTRQRALALAATLLFTTTASIAAAIELSFEPSLTGTPMSPISANSFQWGVGVGISRSSDGTVTASRPSLSDITWTQAFGSSYNPLSAALVTERRFASTFDFFTGPGRSDPYLQVKTGASALTALSIASGGDRPTVSASEAFATVEFDYSDPLRGGSNTVRYSASDHDVSGPLSRTAPVSSADAGPARGLYLRLGSGSDAIYGDSNDVGYENWMELSSFQMGMGIAFDPLATGAGAGSRPSISELTVTHQLDGAVPALLSNLLRGRVIGQATLEYVEFSGSGPVTLMQLELDDVLVSGLSISSGGDRPSLSESFNFAGFTQTTWTLNPDGTRGEADVFSYDILRNETRNRSAPAASIAGFGSGLLAPLPIAAPVPEPQTWALMLGGIVLLGLRLRRGRA